MSERGAAPATGAFEGRSRLVGRVPVPVRTVVKEGVRACAVATSPWRSMPDFLIVGAKRGGTTTLYDALVRHPQVASLVPGIQRIKSPHYFDAHHERGLAWYRSHFPLQRPWGRGGAGGRPIAGDAAPYLLYHPLAPYWAAQEVPDIKVIAMLRDPVERAFSHHWDRVKNGVEHLSFAEAIEAEAERLAGEEAALVADPSTPRPAHEHYSYLGRGDYAPQLARWCEGYPPEQVLVMRSEDFYADPAQVFSRVCEFLGIDDLTPRQFGKHHSHADKPRVEGGLRRELAARFAPSNARLADFLGTPLWWDADGATDLPDLAVLHPLASLAGAEEMTAAQSAAWVFAAVALAGLLAPRLGVAAALVELGLGVVLGNVVHVDARTSWLVILAGLGGVAVTFLAGTQIDPAALRRPGPALLLGGATFGAPFVVVSLIAHLGLGWSPAASLIAATALSETSLAVTYAVLVDLGLVRAATGRLVMAAVFVTDLLAALVLSALTAHPSWDYLLFVAGSVVVVIALPRVLSWVRMHYLQSSSMPAVRVVLLSLVLLLVLAERAGAVAVLPAFVVGVTAGRELREQPEERDRLQATAMAVLAPVFFVRAGMSIAVPVLVTGGSVVALLLVAKVGPKASAALAVLVARQWFPDRRQTTAVAALMSTGLTFGTVACLAGLQAHAIDQRQFSLLAGTVVLSALLPAWCAQRLLARSPTAPTLPLPTQSPERRPAAVTAV